MNFGMLDPWSHWTEWNKIHLHFHHWETDFAIKNFLSAFRVRTPNRQWAKHRQISNQKNFLNDSFVNNLTCYYYAQSSIFF